MAVAVGQPVLRAGRVGEGEEAVQEAPAAFSEGAGAALGQEGAGALGLEGEGQVTQQSVPPHPEPAGMA